MNKTMAYSFMPGISNSMLPWYQHTYRKQIISILGMNESVTVTSSPGPGRGYIIKVLLD